jgi:hypothetical protein
MKDLVGALCIAAAALAFLPEFVQLSSGAESLVERFSQLSDFAVTGLVFFNVGSTLRIAPFEFPAVSIYLFAPPVFVVGALRPRSMYHAHGARLAIQAFRFQYFSLRSGVQGESRRPKRMYATLNFR